MCKACSLHKSVPSWQQHVQLRLAGLTLPLPLTSMITTSAGTAGSHDAQCIRILPPVHLFSLIAMAAAVVEYKAWPCAYPLRLPGLFWDPGFAMRPISCGPSSCHATVLQLRKAEAGKAPQNATDSSLHGHAACSTPCPSRLDPPTCMPSRACQPVLQGCPCMVR